MHCNTVNDKTIIIDVSECFVAFPLPTSTIFFFLVDPGSCLHVRTPWNLDPNPVSGIELNSN
jgi:hypothetical protein